MRGNGHHASWYAPLADLDPPLVDHVLELLAEQRIAAYAEPLEGETGPYRDVRAPDRPTTRVYVDSSRVAAARAVISTSLPELRAEFLADAAARMDADDMRQRREDLERKDFDQQWADLVAGFGPVPEVDEQPREPLSARLIRAESIEDEPDPEAFVPPQPPPIPRPPDAVSRFAWAGVIGGPLVFLAAAVLGLGGTIQAAGFLGFVAGFAVLVSRMKDSRDDDDADGAVV